ncbi:uncharacterized protein SOCEGT47_020700 [Sorangium cellulosum]|uniref:Lipoyl-binding domain-containing protein n=1 Tax=Sorangium cellulosum TaxID=56 RepID=A0A4P2PXN0_SORCE|nr:uncharacterized protein SOCEGT47_020700 [Sorangium cellulosum]
MSQLIEVKVPDIGDYKDVPVIEVAVKPGDVVQAETALMTLESDKATMDVPSPAAGVVKEVKVKVGDRVGEGSLVVILEGQGAAQAPAPAPAAAPQAAAAAARRPRRPRLRPPRRRPRRPRRRRPRPAAAWSTSRCLTSATTRTFRSSRSASRSATRSRPRRRSSPWSRRRPRWTCRPARRAWSRK